MANQRGGGGDGETGRLSRRSILGTIGAGSIAGVAGCGGDGGDGDGGDGTTPGGGNGTSTPTPTVGGTPVDDVFHGQYDSNPPGDIYFNAHAAFGGGIGLQHWTMLFTGIADYDAAAPERGLSAIYEGHPRHTDPIEDGTATIQIRDDHSWHDGEEYTAQDFGGGLQMQQYIYRAADNESALPYSDVRITGDYEIEVDLRDTEIPHAVWWDSMYAINIDNACCTITNGMVWHQHSLWESWFQQLEDASSADELSNVVSDLREEQIPVEEIVGHGPFKIREVSGQSIIYEPHEGWNGLIATNLPGLENGDRVGGEVQEFWVDNDMTANWTFYPEPSVQAQAALQGDLDYVRINSESQGNSLRNQGWELQPPGGSTFASAKSVGFRVNFAHEALAKRQVRQALLHLMNQSQLAQVGFQNTRETSLNSPAPIPVATGMTWAGAKNWIGEDELRENWSQYSPNSADADTATSLLQSAGLTREDGDWYTESGNRFTLDIKTNNSQLQEIVQVFHDQLEQFGIQAETTVVAEELEADIERNGDFDLFWDSHNMASWPADDFSGGFAFTGQTYPWGSQDSVNTSHPAEWDVPGEIGNPDSSIESFDVVPKIQAMYKAGNDFESLFREVAWVYNQAVPSLVYANGDYRPALSEMRAVGQLYNANSWTESTVDESPSLGVMNTDPYPQTRHKSGDLQPKTE